MISNFLSTAQLIDSKIAGVESPLRVLPDDDQLAAWRFRHDYALPMYSSVMRDSHQKAAELHDLAAHAHRVAAEHHEKQDHLTGHEHSRQALEYSRQAHEMSLQAHEKTTANHPASAPSGDTTK